MHSGNELIGICLCTHPAHWVHGIVHDNRGATPNLLHPDMAAATPPWSPIDPVRLQPVRQLFEPLFTGRMEPSIQPRTLYYLDENS